MKGGFHIENPTKGKLPSLPFRAMKDAILGPDYDLTFIIAPKALMQKLNKIHRGINKPTDILSFPLDKKEGEIYLNLQLSKSMAKEFDRSYENFIGFLFIHGLVHLKGYDHGSTMERYETRFRKRFNI